MATLFGGYLWIAYLCIKGNELGYSFLWMCVLALAYILYQYASDIEKIQSEFVIGGMVLFIYTIYVLLMHESLKKTDTAQADIRRLNAESTRRIDETLKVISRSLHDDINPNILMSRNAIQLLTKSHKFPTKIKNSLDGIALSLQDAYNRSRALSQDNCMELIDSIGFVAALESMASHYKTLFSLPQIHLSHNIVNESNIDPNRTLIAFKIIKEAVFNCIKHSKAKNLKISVNYNEFLDECNIKISDDGLGIRDTLKSSNYGIGILDMKERAVMLGAELNIYPLHPKKIDAQGTVVSFTFSGHINN